MALNDRAGISATTRTRVREAARRLGYGRRRRATTLFGVLPTDLGNPYHTDVIAGIEATAETLGAGVVIAHGRRDSVHMERQLQRLIGLEVDGIVAVTTWLPPEALEQAARSVPVTVIGRMQDPVPGTDVVVTDDTAGAALAVRHLVECGHRRITHVTLSRRPGPAARQKGFLAEAARLGLEEAVEVIGPDSADAGIDLLLRGLRRGDPGTPTAVFAANDIAAVRVLHRAADLGVAVPQQLSVVGYDSSAAALTVRPPLTSVNQPRQEMGRIAARMLQERRDGRSSDSRSVAQPLLKVRGSTGPGPARAHPGPGPAQAHPGPGPARAHPGPGHGHLLAQGVPVRRYRRTGTP